jgi:hypothetical protein
MRGALMAGLLCCVATACGGSSAPAPHSQPEQPAGLPIGKADMALPPGEYLSPGGFQPALRLSLAEEWNSVHRGDDAFDIGRPAPDADVPDVAVIFITPRSDDAGQLVRNIADRFDTQVGRGELIGSSATTTTLVGGHGQILRSNGETIGLYADKNQMVRLSGAEVGGSPLVVVVLVLDHRRWPAVRDDVQQLLDGVEPA